MLSNHVLIRFEHVTKQFQEGEKHRAVLNDLTATIGKDEFVAMIGRSGSGKSTLLESGLLGATAGALAIPTGLVLSAILIYVIKWYSKVKRLIIIFGIVIVFGIGAPNAQAIQD